MFISNICQRVFLAASCYSFHHIVPLQYASASLTYVSIIMPYSYTAGELDSNSDKSAERAQLLESRR